MSVSEEVLSQDLSHLILDSLNRQQKNAVTSEAAFLRVLAGAGSGKTRVIVHRIAWFIATGQARPHNILAVTFTNKAANEMRQRIEKLLQLSHANLWVGTFHGLAHRILRRHYAVLGLPENFQIIDSDDQLRMIKRILKEMNLDEEVCEPKRAQGFINKQKDEGKRPHEVSNTTMPDIAMYAEVYRMYDNACKRAGLVDFAEILLLAYELWRDNPAVLEQYRQQFTHILVDEFQDTNTIQYRWLTLLMHAGNHITIVGDDDQSIYGWRGARVENIHKFSKDFPGTETIRLEQNYRSTQTILNSANQLITNNETRLGKELWTEQNKGEPITLYGAFNEMDESKFIVDRINKWIRSGGNLNDIGILYRSNAQSRVLEQSLRQANVPYRVYGGLRFFDRAEIKDVLAYLRLMVNVDDDTALERIINIPPRGVGERTLQNIRDTAKEQNCSLWRAIQTSVQTMSSGRIRNGLIQFIQIIEDMNAQVPLLTLPKLVEKLLHHSGVLMYVKTQPGEKTHVRVENLMEMIQGAEQYHTGFEPENGDKSNSVQSLPAFLSEVALDAGDKEGEGDTSVCVKLMTLHSAKGLEFPVVFMAGMEDGLFPHHRNFEKQALLEEERRLCYVGITRAMQKLYLTYAEKRTFAGLAGSTRRPSRFINELPKNLIETINLNVNAQVGGGAFRSTSTSSSSYSTRTDEKSSYTRSASRSAFGSTGKSTNTDLPYAIGQRVRHARFGEGIVMGGEGKGEAARIQINFKQGGAKWLALAYAKLDPA